MSPPQEPLLPKRSVPSYRPALVLVGLIALLSVALVRFYTLQVVQGPHWHQLAERQHLLKVPQPFLRGGFWLQDPQANIPWPLSYDLSQFHLYADCSQLQESDKQAIVDFLARTFELSPPTLQHLKQQLQRSSRSRRLLSNLSLQQKRAIDSWWRALVKERRLQLNGLFFLQDHVRSHPQSPMLGALTHTTQRLKDEKTQQALPTGGLELYFDRRLQGKLGWRSLKRTLKHPLASSEKLQPAQHGSDLTLTINPRLQAVAEQLLQDALIRFQVKSAWAIAIDPYSGKLLCLAQAPNFNLEHYADYFTDPRRASCAKLWAASNAYEPGSVMKPITLALALTANEWLAQKGEPPLLDPAKLVAVSEGRLPGRRTPLRDTKAARAVNMDLALQISSNIYMAKLMHQLVDRLGDSWYEKALRNLGFGSVSGVELPAETAGLVPTPGRLTPWGALEWSLPTPASLAMGHNILVNSFQLLRVYSALANGGWLVKPTLVQALHTPVAEQPQLQYRAPRDARANSRKVFSLSVCQRVIESMSYTLKSPGSCTRGDIARYSVAAKTGTANKFYAGQYDPNHTLSTFIGILPAQKPQLVLLVSLDEPRYFFIPGQGYNHRASFCAAPLFHHLALQAAGILGIEPDAPESYLPKDPRHDPSRAYWVEQNERLQEIFQKWNSHEEAFR